MNENLHSGRLIHNQMASSASGFGGCSSSGMPQTNISSGFVRAPASGELEDSSQLTLWLRLALPLRMLIAEPLRHPGCVSSRESNSWSGWKKRSTNLLPTGS